MSIKTMLPTYFPPPSIYQNTASFIAPLPKGFHRYRVRYKIHYANGDVVPRVVNLDAQSAEHAKEKMQAFERYKADGPNYRNIESSITISFEEPEILEA